MFKPTMFLSMALAIMSLTTVSCNDDDVMDEPEQPVNKESKYIVDEHGDVTPKTIQPMSVEEFQQSIVGSALVFSKCYVIDKDGAIDYASTQYIVPDILVQNDSITYYPPMTQQHRYKKSIYTYSDNILYYGAQKDVEFKIVSFDNNELVVLDGRYNLEITYKCLKGDDLETFIYQRKDYEPAPMTNIYPSIFYTKN